MYFFKKVVFILFLYDITKAYEIVSPDHMILSWSQEVGKEFKKYYNIQPPVYDVLVGENNHSFALLKCKNSRDPHPKMCNLTIQTHTDEHRVFSSYCDIKPPSERNTITVLQHSVTFLRGDRVLVSWKEHHKIDGWRISSQVIFTDSCHASQFIHVYTKVDENSDVHAILKRRNNFYIIYENEEICKWDKYCYANYDYDGKPIVAPYRWMIIDKKFHFENVYPMMNDQHEGFVLVGRKDGYPYVTKHIYSTMTGWTEINDVSETLYSNSNGYFTFCWRCDGTPNELFCKNLDGIRSNETMNFEFKPYYTKLPLIYNNPSGNVMLINRGTDDNEIINVYVDEVITDIKCKRLAEIPFPKRSDLLAFSMTRTRFCYSYLFKDADWDLAGNPSIMYYTLGTECIKQPHYSTHKQGRCGHNFH